MPTNYNHLFRTTPNPNLIVYKALPKGYKQTIRRPIAFATRKSTKFLPAGQLYNCAHCGGWIEKEPDALFEDNEERRGYAYTCLRCGKELAFITMKEHGAP